MGLRRLKLDRGSRFLFFTGKEVATCVVRGSPQRSLITTAQARSERRARESEKGTKVSCVCAVCICVRVRVGGCVCVCARARAWLCAFPPLFFFLMLRRVVATAAYFGAGLGNIISVMQPSQLWYSYSYSAMYVPVAS